MNRFKIQVKNENWISLIKNIIRIKPDVVFLHHSFDSPKHLFLQIFLKMLNIKIIIGLDLLKVNFVYTLFNFEIKRYREFLKDLIKYPLMYLQILLADGLWCRTQYEKDFIFPVMKHSRNKFIVIPPGHNFKIGTSTKDLYILTISGWWQDRKNLHTVIKVFSEVIKKKKCKLVVVGDFFKGKYKTFDKTGEKYTGKYETGEIYKRKIMDLIEELNLTDYVEFVGVKIGKELEKIFKRAKIYYMPTKCDTFAPVWLGAMSFGTPIVAMKNSCVQYIIKDNVGFLRNTQKRQKKAILRLLTDKKLYEQMRKNCLKEAEKYKWRNIIKEWYRVMDSFKKKKKIVHIMDIFGKGYIKGVLTDAGYLAVEMGKSKKYDVTVFVFKKNFLDMIIYLLTVCLLPIVILKLIFERFVI